MAARTWLPRRETSSAHARNSPGGAPSGAVASSSSSSGGGRGRRRFRVGRPLGTGGPKEFLGVEVEGQGAIDRHLVFECGEEVVKVMVVEVAQLEVDGGKFLVHRRVVGAWEKELLLFEDGAGLLELDGADGPNPLANRLGAEPAGQRPVNAGVQEQTPERPQHLAGIDAGQLGGRRPGQQQDHLGQLGVAGKPEVFGRGDLQQRNAAE